MQLPKVKAVLFTGKTYKDGTHPILIRITKDRRHTYKSTGFSIVLDAWDIDTQRVFEKRPQITKRQEGQLNSEKLSELKSRYRRAVVLSNAAHINSVIEDAIKEIEKLSKKLQDEDASTDVKSVKRQLAGGAADRTRSFITYGMEYYDRFHSAGSIGTYKRYKTVISKLSTYLKQRDLPFKELNIEFLHKYQSYLQGKNKQNTVHANLKAIKAIYLSAIADQIITPEANPFYSFKLKSDNNVKKERLNLQEIISIETLELPTKSLLRDCKNFFLFSFYCAGIRASDALTLRWNNITSDGRLEYQMGKTGRHKSIKLVPKAQAILDNYKRDEPDPQALIFPFLELPANYKPELLFNQISSKTALINKYLKQIADKADVEKPVSTHIARHSFSDIARQRKASIYDISKLLGHSSIKITEAYLASLDFDSQDETMAKVLDF